MEIAAAERLAKQLMTQWECSDWEFVWNNRRRALGSAYHNPATGVKELRLSRHFVRANTLEEVTDVILHEIAHILAGLENGHNAVWKAACRLVGARPERLNTTANAGFKYQLECTCGCGTRVGGFFTKPRKDYSRHRLTTCETSNGLRVVKV